jgi:hypothetical protein
MSPNKEDRPRLPRVQDEGWLVGKLLAHGRARYKADPEAAMSYFIRVQTLETEQGARRAREQAQEAARPVDGRTPYAAAPLQAGGVIERWGMDLERAIRESKSAVAVGKTIAAKIISREPLVSEDLPNSPRRGRTGYWNRWEVETVQFVAQRHRFARAVNENFRNARREGIEGGEALALYFIHQGAERLATARYPNPEDRQAFLARLKNFLDVSPERETVIAGAVRRIQARKAALASAEAAKAAASPPTDRELDREPLIR